MPLLLVAFCVAPEIYQDTGYIAYYVTKPSYQGKGIGGTLFRRALQRHKSHNITLRAVPGTEGMYKKYGFFKSSFPLRAAEGVPTLDNVGDYAKNTKTSKISDANEDSILQFDRSACGYDRSVFMKKRMSGSNTIGRCIVNDGFCIGYIMLRKHKTSYRCYGFYADSLDAAKCLLYECLLLDFEAVPHILFYYPHENGVNIKSLLEPLHIDRWNKLFVTFMYTKHNLIEALDTDRIYGVIPFCAAP